jgi:predicted permease
MTADIGLLNSFLAAIQASLSVLLVIFYGGVAARLNLLNSSTAKVISKICVKMFLPALLLTQIGSELHSGSAHRYALILLWAVVCHLISFLIGVAAHLLFGLPDWITAAIMFNNTTSYPLLLIQSLDQTGILKNLIITDETTHAAISRAKSYFLVFATVSSCLTFAVGPRLIDMEHAPDPAREEDKDDDEEDGYEADEETEVGCRPESDGDISPTEQSQLLFAPTSGVRRRSVVPVSFFPSKPREDNSKATTNQDRRPSIIKKDQWFKLSERTRWWLLFAYDFVNAPVLGALAGAVIGLTPVLHVAFFSHTQDGGIFTAWFTESLRSIGSLFVPLPVVIAGVSLYTATQRSKTNEHEGKDSSTPWAATAFILIVRFVLWPVFSITVVYYLANSTEFLGDDPMLWFALML